LIWYCPRWGSRARRNQEGGCPSWSPLSIQVPGGQVDFYSLVIGTPPAFFSTVSASTNVRGLNPFGLIDGSELRLRCLVKRARVCEPVHVDEDFDTQALDLEDRGSSKRIGILWRDVPGEITCDGAPFVTCAAVAHAEGKFDSEIPEEPPGIACLALVAVGNGKPSVYRRVGLAMVYSDFTDLGWFKGCSPSEISICKAWNL